MAYNATTGQWEDEDASVTGRVTGLLSQNNPLIQQARTQGAQASNRRGLLNSSMGVQAGQTAAYSAALPIASQEAGQVHQTNMQGRDIASREQMQGRDIEAADRRLATQLDSQRDLTVMNLAAGERQHAASIAANFESSYAQMVSNIMNNPEIPASAREQYIKHAAMVRDSNLQLVEQMYGIDLQWSTPGAPAGSNTNTPAGANTTETGISNPNDIWGQWLTSEQEAEERKRLQRILGTLMIL